MEMEWVQFPLAAFVIGAKTPKYNKDGGNMSLNEHWVALEEIWIPEWRGQTRSLYNQYNQIDRRLGSLLVAAVFLENINSDNKTMPSEFYEFFTQKFGEAQEVRLKNKKHIELCESLFTIFERRLSESSSLTRQKMCN